MQLRAAAPPGLLGLSVALLLAAAPAPSEQQQGTRSTPLGYPGLVSYLLDRLGEPIFMPKGNLHRFIFRVPPNYVNSRFQSLLPELESSAAAVWWDAGAKEVAVPVGPVPGGAVPCLGPAAQLGRYEQFSLFIPRHRRAARQLIEIFLGLPSNEDFLIASAFCRDHVNPFLFAYAVAVAMLHRPDTRTVPLPNAACLFPHKYIDGRIFSRAREEATVLGPGRRQPIVIPRDWTASDLEPEHRVAYFREDVGINLFHWHWHLVYPFDGPRAIVDKDRRGELFYYVHQQIMARFNFERLSNGLSRAKRLNNWREPIKEGYFPKLTMQIASREWPSRQAGAKLSDVHREDQDLVFDILDLERWRDRIMEAVHTRRVQTETGEFVALDEARGIDILGNLLEASNIAINRNFYGDLHNFGHMAISFVHDPDNRHLEPFAVMGDPTTAMRDPVFYRWHAFVQSVFEEHKAMMPRYPPEELNFADVEVLRWEVQTRGSGRINEFNTFWQQSDIDISRGLDFAPRGPVFVRVTHLQHAPFVYNLEVRNGANAAREATVRILLAPLLDERRRPLFLRDQRTLFIELDKFRVRLLPGASRIARWHNESSVTIPPERTFRSLDQRPPGAAGSQFDYCGCGWPQHMLLPRGSPEGQRAVLFVMVSDFSVDQVRPQTEVPNACADAHSYCGVLGQLFPDSRSMGFPMDRLPRAGVATLNDFLTPNMAATEVVIRHDDRTVAPGAAG